MEESTENKTYRSVSEGAFESKFWRAHTDKEWTLIDSDSNSNSENKSEDDVSGVVLKDNIELSLPPTFNRGRKSKNNRNNIGGSNDRFHEDLKTDDLDGMVVLFEAKAEQCISLTLSPWPSSGPIQEGPQEETSASETAISSEAPATTGIVYDIVLGTNNNTTSTIRRSRRGGSKKKGSTFVSVPSRVCRGFGADNGDDAWTSYWVCLSNSKLYVGMGKIPGKECFGVLEEAEQPNNETSHEGKDENAEASTEESKENEVNDNSKDLPIRYVGIGNSATFQKDSIVAIKNLLVTNVPPSLDSLLKAIPSQDELPVVCLAPAILSSSSGMDVDEDAETLELRKYMEDYKAECIVRKKRALKYGTSYKAQPMKDFLPWTMAKRLQGKHGSNTNNLVGAGVGSGFVAGDIDFLDPKEISKREARLARFAANDNKDENGAEKGDAANDASMILSPVRDGLPIEQAWDKESMLRPIRRDPPPYLWKESPANSDTLKIAKTHDPFSMYDESTKAATWIPDKLHISSIDWAAFKQIRNNDLIKHLEAYGPIKYIEWLGDVSCNVCFANKASASRALVCLSNELPSPPPQSTTNESTAPESEKKEDGVDGLPPKSPTSAPAIDLGCMTWRLSKRPIRKLSNDRHGRKGTIARYLLRVATTEDVLIERPNYWPEPPGGFASDRVLGPKSDYASARNKRGKAKSKGRNPNPQQQQSQQQQQQKNKKGSNSKRKRGRGENSGNQSNSKKNGNERRNNNNKKASNPVDLLNRGLSASRGGFSVEEMEKERQAKKRQKTS